MTTPPRACTHGIANGTPKGRSRFIPWVVALLGVIGDSSSHAQEGPDEPLRLNGVRLPGVRGSLTESWGTLQVEVTNFGPTPRTARVTAFYPDRPDIQYSKDVYVPGGTVVVSWLAVGPVTDQAAPLSREMEILLYDRTGGKERPVLPKSEERTRSRTMVYRPREPTTALLLDAGKADPVFDQITSDPVSEEPIALARTMRETSTLSENLAIIQDRFLPPLPEAFDGIDVLVLASNRLAVDPVGRQTIRRWVHQGGVLWVHLDRVAPDTVASILGDDMNFQVVDRVGLTTIRLHRSTSDPARADAHDVDQPVDLVRVVLGGGEVPLHTVNGWPASFSQTLGRGRVVFTTLGSRGWMRPRTAQDPRPKFKNHPDLPLASNPLAELGQLLHPQGEQPKPPLDALRELLMQQVGYEIVGRGTATAVFIGLIVGVVGLGVLLRRSRHVSIGWLAPIGAGVATVAFVILGNAAHRGIPPTVGVAEVVDAVPGSNEAAGVGVVSLYQPQSGPVTLRSDSGALLELDDAGLEGGIRQRVVTDSTRWHWEGLNLPAGLRTGTYRSHVRARGLSATARFGEHGLEGRFRTASFTGATDAIVVTPNREPLTARLHANEEFSVGAADALRPGQYLDASVLTDRQQRHQEVYRQLLGGKLPRHWEGQNLLLAWAEPSDVPFQMGEGVRSVGASLLAVPLEFERPPLGSAVTVPRAFVSFARIQDGIPRPAPRDGQAGVEMLLRFQVPRSVLPLTVERLRFTAAVKAPKRRFIVSGAGEAASVVVSDTENPIEPIQVEITDPRLLRVDASGGLYLTVKVTEQIEENVPAAGDGKAQPPQPPGGGGQPPFGGKGRPPGGKGGPSGTTPPKGPNAPLPALSTPDLPWAIESMGLEVVGRTHQDR